MLHELVARHAQSLLAELRDADPDGGGLPRYVERNAIEGEKYSPRLEMAFEIASIFGLPLEQVFTYEPRAGARLKRRPLH